MGVFTKLFPKIFQLSFKSSFWLFHTKERHGYYRYIYVFCL